MVQRSKEKSPARENGLIRVLFLIYLLFLFWAVLWKFNMPYIGDGTLRHINVTPFQGNTLSEMRFNILVFMPFGLYISMLAPKRAFAVRVCLALLCSALFEVLQYALAIGRSDITDLILNTLGGVAGMAFFSLLSRLLGKKAPKALRGVCVAVTVLVLAVAGFFVLRGRIRIV